MTTDVDSAAAELAAARRNLNRTLVVASSYVAARAAAGDELAARINAMVDSAFDRLTLANIAGHTVMEESRG